MAEYLFVFLMLLFPIHDTTVDKEELTINYILWPYSYARRDPVLVGKQWTLAL